MIRGPAFRVGHLQVALRALGLRMACAARIEIAHAMRLLPALSMEGRPEADAACREPFLPFRVAHLAIKKLIALSLVAGGAFVHRRALGQRDGLAMDDLVMAVGALGFLDYGSVLHPDAIPVDDTSFYCRMAAQALPARHPGARWSFLAGQLRRRHADQIQLAVDEAQCVAPLVAIAAGYSLVCGSLPCIDLRTVTKAAGGRLNVDDD